MAAIKVKNKNGEWETVGVATVNGIEDINQYDKGFDDGRQEGYNHGYISGRSEGLDAGRAQGREAEAMERDAIATQQIADINTKVTAYGVSEAETLSKVPLAIDLVYAKGSQDGYASGHSDGYNVGHAAGLTEGAQSEYDRFWDAFQDYGTRTDYSWAFRRWNTDYIRPKYPVRNLSMKSESFFQYSAVKKIEGLYFDFTGIDKLPAQYNSSGSAYAMFNACRQLEIIEDLNIPAVDYYATWYNCVSLKEIAVVRCAAGKTFTSAFVGCSALEKVTFTGTLSTNGLDLQHSTNLSKESIESLIGVLSASASGKTVTLSETAVNKAFETSDGADDGIHSDAWTELVDTKSNWTISLV